MSSPGLRECGRTSASCGRRPHPAPSGSVFLAAGRGLRAGSLGPEEMHGPPRPVWGEQVTHPREGGGCGSSGRDLGRTSGSACGVQGQPPLAFAGGMDREWGTRGAGRGRRPPTGSGGAGGGTPVAGAVGAGGAVLAPHDWPHLGRRSHRALAECLRPDGGPLGGAQKLHRAHSLPPRGPRRQPVCKPEMQRCFLIF